MSDERTGRRRDAGGTALRWVAHPATVLATVALLVNDHVLKAAWPGPVTGKLSDVAGLVVAPPLLAVAVGLLLPRLPALWLGYGSLAVTGAGFGWVKLTDGGAAAASAAWSVVAGPSYILKDPTDLIALPALVLAGWAWRRSRRAPSPDETQVAAVRLLLGLPLAMLAVAATSAPNQPDAVTVVEERDGKVVVAGTFDPLVAGADLDHWRRLAPGEPPLVEVDPGDEQGLDRLRQLEACVPGEPAHCYRAHGDNLDAYRDDTPNGGRVLGVDESTDGGLTWRTAWEMPAGRWLFLAREHELWRNRDDKLLASVDILVREVPGGHQVIVANGVEGLLVRDAGGDWRRVGIALPEVAPSPVPVPSDATSPPPQQQYQRAVEIRPARPHGFGRHLAVEGAWAVLAVLIAMTLGGYVVTARIFRVRPLGAALWAALPLTGLAVAVVFGVGVLLFIDSTLASGLALLLAIFLVLQFGMLQRDVPRLRGLLVSLSAVGSGVAFLAPYLAWSAGWLESYPDAKWYAWLTGGAGLLLTAAVAWYAARHPIPPRPPPPRYAPGGPDYVTGPTGSGAPSKSTIE
ncbi:MAG: hypothetical protein ACRDT4_04660 [Micromonosporaceae bacterium]